ncbi:MULTISPECIES: protein-L-isoaspartate O-methyltransferase family protein [Streptomyces]|uniref:protein-L-isoaspartate O-methyltransferase family protein n=1 Tax=Streptomyces TaxID=1883 RepID=UPI0034491375
MNAVALAAESVPERHYTHHEGRGPTPHRSNPAVIHRELTTLDIRPGHKVAEYGTGSGLTGALLAELVGRAGSVTSLDIDAFLVRWANLIHHERGVDNVRCHTADGTGGFAKGAPYDRMVAWCTPPLLPKAWVDQIAGGGLIVAPLPIAAVPNMTVVAKIRVNDGEPGVEAVFTGGYIEATASPKGDLDLPGRWVDWENRAPAPSWISIAWRGDDDPLHTGARTALGRLLNAAHTEPYDGRRSTGRPGAPSPQPSATTGLPWPGSAQTCGRSATPPPPQPPSSSRTAQSSPTSPTPRPWPSCMAG